MCRVVIVVRKSVLCIASEGSSRWGMFESEWQHSILIVCPKTCAFSIDLAKRGLSRVRSISFSTSWVMMCGHYLLAALTPSSNLSIRITGKSRAREMSCAASSSS